MNVRGNWSERAAVVARWFGVDRQDAQALHPSRVTTPPLALQGGQIVLLTGPSGAGKSTLLHCLGRKHSKAGSWIDLQSVHLPKCLVIDAMAEAMGGGSDEASIVAALEALSRFGLGEVWSYLRTPGELSEGQRWRLRLALALARARENPGSKLRGLCGGEGRGLVVLAADEFAAPLDRVTALVVARALRRAVSARGDLCAIVATTREDLVGALDPDVIVRCDFGIFSYEERGSS